MQDGLFLVMDVTFATSSTPCPSKLDEDAQCGSGTDDEVARGVHVAHVQALLQALGNVAEAARGWPDQR
jgi:hypothetical protein